MYTSRYGHANINDCHTLTMRHRSRAIRSRKPSLQHPWTRQFHFGAKNSLYASHSTKMSIATSLFASQHKPNQTGTPHMASQNFSHHPHTLPHRHPSGAPPKNKTPFKKKDNNINPPQPVTTIK